MKARVMVKLGECKGGQPCLYAPVFGLSIFASFKIPANQDTSFFLFDAFLFSIYFLVYF